MAGLIPRLVQQYDEEGIPFCHWKGAAELERALRGERDLDLLVSPDDYPRAVEVLLRNGWRRAAPLVGRDDPGTSHFLGHDPSVDRLLHVHLHDRVLTGENLINSHVLPLGPAILDDAVWHLGVRTASPPAVTVIGVLKAAIRRGSLPDRLASLVGRSPKAVEVTRGPELEAAAAWLRANGALIDEETFGACAALLGNGASRRERRRLARQVRSALRPWSRYTRLGRYGAYARWLTARFQRLVGRTRSGRVLATGGAWIVLPVSAVEDDAAADMIRRWLGQAIAVKTFRCSAWRVEPEAGQDPSIAHEGPAAAPPPVRRVRVRSALWSWRARRVMRRSSRAAGIGYVSLTNVSTVSTGRSTGEPPGPRAFEILLAAGDRRPDAIVEAGGMDTGAIRSLVWVALGSAGASEKHAPRGTHPSAPA